MKPTRCAADHVQLGPAARTDGTWTRRRSRETQRDQVGSDLRGPEGGGRGRRKVEKVEVGVGVPGPRSSVPSMVWTPTSRCCGRDPKEKTLPLAGFPLARTWRLVWHLSSLAASQPVTGRHKIPPPKKVGNPCFGSFSVPMRKARVSGHRRRPLGSQVKLGLP